MSPTHHEVRDELIAILGAARELPPEADRHLADGFVTYLAQRDRPKADVPVKQSPNALVFAGMIWGIAFLSLAYLWVQMFLDEESDPNVAAIATVIVIVIAASLARTVLYLGQHGWRIPHLHITVSQPDNE